MRNDLSSQVPATTSRRTVAGVRATGDTPACRTRRWFAAILLASALALCAAAVLRTAWLCDDAYITYRTVDNFVHGYGLTWNTLERVQAYTHPLWMFLLSGVYFLTDKTGLTSDIYYPAILLCMTLSLAAVLVYALWIARSVPHAIVGLMVLAFSRAFIDYSTSGLENPLTFLLLALFLGTYLQDTPLTPRRLLGLSLLAGLGTLNRMDTLLLFAPALLQAWWTAGLAPVAPAAETGTPPIRPRSPLAGRIRLLGIVAAGFLPFVAWEAFSLVYYGFLFPNTAYAKLNTDIPAGELARQGVAYLLDSLRRDPVTLPAIAVGLLLAFRSRHGRPIAAAIGILLYLLYILKIGGDFMSGRFFAAPLLVAVILAGRMSLNLARVHWLVTALVPACLGLLAPNPSLLTGSSYGLGWGQNIEGGAIADERGYYYVATGLLADPLNLRHALLEVIDTARKRRAQESAVTGFGMVGVYGYHVGPRVHVIDYFALADPLLARLPMKYDPRWRIGHFVRHVPDGYVERLDYLRSKQAHDPSQGTANLQEQYFADANLEALHDKICLITRGPLFTRQRWRAIWDMNLGRYNHLVNRDFYRHAPERVWLGEVHGGPKPRNIQRNLPRDPRGALELPANGFIVILGATSHAPRIELSAEAQEGYRIEYPQPGRRPVPQEIRPLPGRQGLVVRQVEVPPDVVKQGYSRLRIRPAGDKPSHLGYLRPLVPAPR